MENDDIIQNVTSLFMFAALFCLILTWFVKNNVDDFNINKARIHQSGEERYDDLITNRRYKIEIIKT